MRFFDELLVQYRRHALVNDVQRFMARQFAGMMESPRTKRILFDSRQAALFAELGERPPQDVQETVRPPFDRFFLELDEPIVLGGSGPEDAPDSPTNLCRAFMLLHQPDIDLTQVVMYFTTSDWSVETGDGYFDARIFMLDLQNGLPLASAKTLREQGVNDKTLVPDDLAEDALVLVTDREEWAAFEWPSNLLVYAGLTDWILTYMLARGIRIVEEPLPRQQRRALARKGLPNPWHIVTVGSHTVGGNTGGAGSRQGHRYRYDVMGFIRRGRHRLKDGTYRETVEWVRPHQRGLRNQTYIPRVSRFEAEDAPEQEEDTTSWSSTTKLAGEVA